MRQLRLDRIGLPLAVFAQLNSRFFGLFAVWRGFASGRGSCPPFVRSKSRRRVGNAVGIGGRQPRKTNNFNDDWRRGAPPRRDPPRDGDVIEPLALDDEAFEARKAAAKRQAVAFVEGLPSPLVNHAPLRVEDAQSDRVG